MTISTGSGARGASILPIIKFIFFIVFVAGFLHGFVDFDISTVLPRKLAPLPEKITTDSQAVKPEPSRTDQTQPESPATQVAPEEGIEKLLETADQQEMTLDKMLSTLELLLEDVFVENLFEVPTQQIEEEKPVVRDFVEVKTVVEPTPVQADPETDLFTYTERPSEPAEITDPDVKKADELYEQARELMKQWTTNRSTRAIADAYKLLQECQTLYRRAEARHPRDEHMKKYIETKLQMTNELLYIAMKHSSVRR